MKELIVESIDDDDEEEEEESFSDESNDSIEKNIIIKNRLEMTDDAKELLQEVFGELVQSGKSLDRNASLPMTVFEKINIIRFRRGQKDKEHEYTILKEDVVEFQKTKMNEI